MIITFILLIIFAIISRLVPHAANIAPIAAMGIFVGLYGTKKQAIVLPIAARLLSDIVLGFDAPLVMASIYIATLIGSGLGIWAKTNKSLIRITAATLFGSISFFIITNAAVWAFTPLYAKNILGLFESYTLALPFFRNTLLGDMVYIVLLVGGYECIKKFVQIIKQRRGALWQPLN